MMPKLRSNSRITINGLMFSPILDFPLGKLATSKNVVDRLLGNIRNQPFIFKQPCHNQVVERHIKLVSKASSKVIGFQKRDGLIWQKIKSRKLFKHFDTKKQYK